VSTVSTEIYDLLAAGLPHHGSPEVEIVPLAGIKPPGDYQKMTLPYVIHFPVSEAATHAHGALVTGREWLYQVSTFASSMESCQTVANAIRSILGHVKTSSGVTIMYQDGRYLGREDTTGVHQWAQDFRVTEALGV